MGSELAGWPPRERAASAGDAGVTRVRFTAEDLARTRFCLAPSPLAEAVLGLAELRRPGARASRSRGRAGRALPSEARPVLDLIPATGYWPEFLDPVVADLDEGLDLVCATPRQVLRQQVSWAWRGQARPPSWLQSLADGEPEALATVRRGLRALYAACVAPRWPTILTSFRADIVARVPTLAASGLAGVFGTLHPTLTWRDGSLERAWRTAEIALGGHGLRLMPSASWTGPPLLTLGSGRPEYSALIYPARPASHDLASPGDLAGLLGRTRAAALQSLRDPCGTAELAARIGISAASASQHAAVLRRADLVKTARHGRGVRHSLTPLGRSLLHGNAAPDGQRDRTGQTVSETDSGIPLVGGQEWGRPAPVPTRPTRRSAARPSPGRVMRERPAPNCVAASDRSGAGRPGHSPAVAIRSTCPVRLRTAISSL